MMHFVTFIETWSLESCVPHRACKGGVVENLSSVYSLIFFSPCFILSKFGVVCVGQSGWCAKDFLLLPRPQAGAVLPALVL